MKSIRICLPEELERQFRKLSMEKYGYSSGSLSLAAASAIRSWISEHEAINRVEIPDEPVKVVRGLLRHVKKSSVELQHEAMRIRAAKAKQSKG